MRIVERTIYNFQELPPDTRKKVFEKYRNWNVEDGFWYEHIIEYWVEELSRLGFEEAEVSFSGFWSQGDGASFTCKDIDFHSLADHVLMCDELNWKEARAFILCSRAYELNMLNSNVYRINNHYSHANTVSVSVYEEFNPRKGNEKNNMEIASDMVFDYLKDMVNDLCRKIYDNLEEEFEYQTSDDTLIDAFLNDETEFTANGVIYNGEDG